MAWGEERTTSRSPAWASLRGSPTSWTGMIRPLPSPSVMRAHTWPLANSSGLTPLTSVRALTEL